MHLALHSGIILGSARGVIWLLGLPREDQLPTGWRVTPALCGTLQLQCLDRWCGELETFVALGTTDATTARTPLHMHGGLKRPLAPQFVRVRLCVSWCVTNAWLRVSISFRSKPRPEAALCHAEFSLSFKNRFGGGGMVTPHGGVWAPDPTQPMSDFLCSGAVR